MVDQYPNATQSQLDQDVSLTQEQLDLRTQQREQSVKVENELREEIAKNSPHISDLVDLGVIKSEFSGNIFEDSFNQLYTRYKQVRRLRRDGNCFYRAYLFQIFEYFILNMKKPEGKAAYESFLKFTTDSKEDLMINAGYEEIVIEDFYNMLLTAVKDLATVSVDKAQEHLVKLLSNQEEANYIIMYFRFIAACHLKKNSIMFEGFIGPVDEFCQREVEQLDVEADHPQIMAITGYFNLGVEINQVTHNGKIDVLLLPEEGYNGFRPKLLFVPGHYDALYQ